MNTTKTEPTTAAEIDALFSATVNERDFRPFLCTQPGCNKSFTSFDQLQTHETNMHGTKNMICGIDGCTKGFATSGQLTKHRKMVHYRTSAKKKAATMAAKAAQKEKEDSVDIENGGEAAWAQHPSKQQVYLYIFWFEQPSFPFFFFPFYFHLIFSSLLVMVGAEYTVIAFMCKPFLPLFIVGPSVSFSTFVNIYCLTYTNTVQFLKLTSPYPIFDCGFQDTLAVGKDLADAVIL